MSQLLAERYQQRLESLADQTARRLALMWAAITTRGDVEAAWLATARPLLAAASQRSILLSAAYVKSTVPGLVPSPVSDLIIPDAVAHVWDPLGATWTRLGQGETWEQAVSASETDVMALGDDVVMGSGRDAVADQMRPVTTKYRRRLNSGACQWCMSLARVEWYSAHEATFGHTRCRCVAIPVADLGDHNETLLDAAGWDAQAQRNYKKRAQIARLRESENLAMKRSREAAKELRSERDPDRRERLSMREQDWETRAERAAEKRHILESGTRRSAA